MLAEHQHAVGQGVGAHERDGQSRFGAVDGRGLEAAGLQLLRDLARGGIRIVDDESQRGGGDPNSASMRGSGWLMMVPLAKMVRCTLGESARKRGRWPSDIITSSIATSASAELVLNTW